MEILAALLNSGGLIKAESIRTFAGHRSPVYASLISPNGQFLISGSGDNLIKIWDLEQGFAIRTLSSHTDKVTDLAVGATGEILISSSQDQTIKLWNLNTGELLNTLDSKAALSIDINSDDKILVSGDSDGKVYVWQAHD